MLGAGSELAEGGKERKAGWAVWISGRGIRVKTKCDAS